MGQAKDRKQLLEAAAAEMDQMSEPILAQFHIAQAMIICGALQVALRTPNFSRGPSADVIRGFIKCTIDSVPEDMPATRQLLIQGFNPQFAGEDPAPRPNAKCRVCGCTEEKACTTPQGPCYWVEDDLCSACAPAVRSLVLPGR